MIALAWLSSAPAAPLLIAGSGVPALGVRHDEHLMARFAATRSVVGIERTIPVLWGYERVAGAQLDGQAPPAAPAGVRGEIIAQFDDAATKLPEVDRYLNASVRGDGAERLSYLPFWL